MPSYALVMSGRCREPFLWRPVLLGSVARVAGEHDVLGVVPAWSATRDDVIVCRSWTEAIGALALYGCRVHEVGVPDQGVPDQLSSLDAGRMPHEAGGPLGSSLGRLTSSDQASEMLWRDRSVNPSLMGGADVGSFFGRLHAALLDRADLRPRFGGRRMTQVGKARLLAGLRSVMRSLEHREPPSTRLGWEPMVEAPTPLPRVHCTAGGVA